MSASEALWAAVAGQIEGATGSRFRMSDATPVTGGCINRAYRIEGEGGRYFVKLNGAAGLTMFEAESAGLLELAESGAIRVPNPVCVGSAAGQSFLVLEFIGFAGRGDPAALGRQLAGLHAVTREQFGWWRDNTIGSTPQINTLNADWIRFWREQRLGFQLRRASDQGYGGRLQSRGERLLDHLEDLLTEHGPRPSLLHGDLWGGNAAYDESGAPVVFDPAVYFGDRETDIAMTELFGGFGSEFYAAYREAAPLDPGYPVRKTLYNLYHILNHLNLFGGGYGVQAEGMISTLLAELGH